MKVTQDVYVNSNRFQTELDDGAPAPNGNFDLIITLKICLRPNDGRIKVKDWGKKDFVTEPWKPENWANFKASFLTSGQEFWDNKFWLSTPGEILARAPHFSYEYHKTLYKYTTFNSDRFPHIFMDSSFRVGEPNHYRVRRKRNINCRFNLVLTDEANAHKTIDIYNIKDPDAFRSDSDHLTQGDLITRNHDFDGRVMFQKTHLHEIGHNLGLEHSALVRKEAKCLKVVEKLGRALGNGDTLCYLGSFESASDIMGVGMTLSEYDALPWQTAMESHTTIKAYKWLPSVDRELRPNFLLDSLRP